MWLSGGLSGRCYPDVGYPVGCQVVVRTGYPDEGYPGGLSGRGLSGNPTIFGRWTTGDLIPTSSLRRGYLIWRLILVVACTLSRSKFALSDLIGPYRPFFYDAIFFL